MYPRIVAEECRLFLARFLKKKKSFQQMIAEVDLTFLRIMNLRQQQKARIYRQRSCEEERKKSERERPVPGKKAKHSESRAKGRI